MSVVPNQGRLQNLETLLPGLYFRKIMRWGWGAQVQALAPRQRLRKPGNPQEAHETRPVNIEQVAAQGSRLRFPPRNTAEKPLSAVFAGF